MPPGRFDGVKLTDMSFEERMKYDKKQMRAVAISNKQKEDIKAKHDLEIGIGNTTPEMFVKHCKERFGNLRRAWQNHFDADGNGKLSFIEFTDAVRHLGYHGSIKELYKFFDADNSGVPPCLAVVG